MYLYLLLDAAPFRWTATVMWNRGDIGNAGDVKPIGVQRPNRRFPAGAGASDTNIHILHTHVFDGVAAVFGGNLGSKGGAFTRPAKSGASSGGPGQRITLSIRDRYNGVIK